MGSRDDTTPEISGDGLALVYASSRPGGSGLYDLYQATRVVRGAAWSAPVRLFDLASTSDEFAGSLAPDRLTIVFLELNDVSYNSDPWLAPDLRTIFHSRLEGSVRNVFVATR